MEKRSDLDPRNAGRSSWEEATNLQHSANHGVPLEAKGALNRIRLSGNFHLFEPAITPEVAQKPVIDESLAILGGGRAQSWFA